MKLRRQENINSSCRKKATSKGAANMLAAGAAGRAWRALQGEAGRPRYWVRLHV